MQEWNFVKINAGYGSEGFFFNESGLQFATGEGFAGWLGEFSFVTPFFFTRLLHGGFEIWKKKVWTDTAYLACDWFHGVPQLFWISFYDGDLFPSTCAQVDLLPVAA